MSLQASQTPQKCHSANNNNNNLYNIMFLYRHITMITPSSGLTVDYLTHPLLRCVFAVPHLKLIQCIPGIPTAIITPLNSAPSLQVCCHISQFSALTHKHTFNGCIIRESCQQTEPTSYQVCCHSSQYPEGFYTGDRNSTETQEAVCVCVCVF